MARGESASADAGPDFRLELSCRGPVAGIDEAGCGPLAGPVVAAAVILDPDCIPDGINDSKKLTAAKRETLAAELAGCAYVATGIATVEEIDRINIAQAALLAMRRAYDGLPVRPATALVDGIRKPQLACERHMIVGGDAKSLSIAAASIIAKTLRDGMMAELAQAHPGYGFEKHMGYATAAHRAAILRLGPCAAHRKSFAPIRNMLSPQAPEGLDLVPVNLG